MRNRSLARECALQLLYQWDLTKTAPEELHAQFWEQRPEPPDVQRFAHELVRGTIEHLSVIDETLQRYAENWALARMAVVDRNILRLGTFELLFVEDIPSKVTINEAVELAKRFGDTESSKFINGVLDKIHKTACPQKWLAAQPAPVEPPSAPPPVTAAPRRRRAAPRKT